MSGPLSRPLIFSSCAPVMASCPALDLHDVCAAVTSGSGFIRRCARRGAAKAALLRDAPHSMASNRPMLIRSSPQLTKKTVCTSASGQEVLGGKIRDMLTRLHDLATSLLLLELAGACQLSSRCQSRPTGDIFSSPTLLYPKRSEVSRTPAQRAARQRHMSGNLTKAER